jgi:hypothetical protein
MNNPRSIRSLPNPRSLPNTRSLLTTPCKCGEIAIGKCNKCFNMMCNSCFNTHKDPIIEKCYMCEKPEKHYGYCQFHLPYAKH